MTRRTGERLEQINVRLYHGHATRLKLMYPNLSPSEVIRHMVANHLASAVPKLTQPEVSLDDLTAHTRELLDPRNPSN